MHHITASLLQKEIFMLSVTSLYASMLTILFIVLSGRVIMLRMKNGVGLLDGGVTDLTRAIRAQGNFAEYVPLALILLVLMELAGTPSAPLHAYGIALFTGRVLHAFSVVVNETRSDTKRYGTYRFRTAGMVLTLTPMLLAALGLLAHSLYKSGD